MIDIEAIQDRAHYTVCNIGRCVVDCPPCGKYDLDTKQFEYPGILLRPQIDGREASMQIISGAHAKALLQVKPFAALVQPRIGRPVIEIRPGKQV